MNKEDIIRMAREAGCVNCDCCLPDPEPHEIQEFIERFAALVAEHILRERLAQPEQEPVAWLYRDAWGVMKLSQTTPPPVGAFPVYTTPQQRPWVGLTAADIKEIWKGEPMLLPWDMTRTLAIEAKLKEKNT
jgi:hypothetical protein